MALEDTTPKAQKSDAVLREERVLAFWKKHQIFEKSLGKAAPQGDFIFYEGPPTANGKPGVHHLESRAFKDLFPRYKTMQGYRVPRRAGWDTHGLPVELEVEKKLGFTGKKDIEAYGVAKFNAKCRESVFTYIKEWEKFTERIGYWVDQDSAYFTFDPKFMESVWALLKKISDDDRLYLDYKVLPWCARCGTALSSHELAQGYEDVKDLSVTVKFELTDESGTYFLAWTTTPWTLPGNVALAVGKDISYARVKAADAVYIVATDLVSKYFEGQEYEVVSEIKGSELVGKKYTPLFPYLETLASDTEKAKFETAFQVHGADFVTADDGTGIVHTAVMYGQDDFELGTKIGLPKVHTVGADGRFLAGTGFLEGRFVKEEDEHGKPTVAVDIINDLKSRNLFFSQENYKHSYPFCWRCKTPLIYYARESWYIRMHDLRETMVAENKKVHWEPEHIRDGRMGEWLSGAKEWALSRERYWGTPLPVWENRTAGERLVVGSVAEIRERVKKSGNIYFAMRHGQAEHNVAGVLDSSDIKKWPLTETGREQVRSRGKELAQEGITKIFASPMQRTRETAALIAEELGIPAEEIVYDERLRELNMGSLDGRPHAELMALRTGDFYTTPVPGGESNLEAKKRFGSFMYELEEKYAHEKILIVTHGIGLEVIPAIVEGAGSTRAQEIQLEGVVPEAAVIRVDFVPLPHNEAYELDLHRPYIDDVVLVSDTGNELRRVKEVMDVWFDSGAMPYAQDHYPFQNTEWIDGPGYPADYISEAIDQTRGWFYTLMALGVLSGKGAPYKNVICLGHLLDAEGKKMSKSKGNVVNPWEAIEQYGADTLRLWMYWVNQPGDSKSFDEKTVKEAGRILSWFENSAKFYELFRDGVDDQEMSVKREQLPVLDQWMHARVDETIVEATRALDAYQPYEATRAIGGLIEDLSQWYVRRVRDRAREKDVDALRTLRETLHTCALLLAPFAPFIAEDIFGMTRRPNDPESVHLASWPAAGKGVDTDLISDMKRIRTLASEGLMLRQKQGVKVSQPLASITISESFGDGLLELLKEELNVMDVIVQDGAFELDTTLTPELIAKGDRRTFARALADARKQMGLEPQDTVVVQIEESYADSLRSGEYSGVGTVVFVPKEGHELPWSADISTGTVHFNIIQA